MDAAHNGDIDKVNYCIAKGWGINDKNRNGYTALHHAVMNMQACDNDKIQSCIDHIQVLKILIANGAKVNAPDENGYNSFSYGSQ